MLKLIYLYIVAKILYNEKITSKQSVLVSSILFLILYYCFSLSTINIIFSTYIISIFYFKMLLKKEDINYYLLSTIAIIGFLFSNYFIAYLYLLIIYLTRNSIIKLINYLNNHKKLLFIIINVVYLIILIYLLIYPIPITKLSNIITIIIINNLIIISNETTIQNYYLSKKYQELDLYSTNNDALIANYRSINHENKNQLIIIRSMLEENSEELDEYINSLIEKETKIPNKRLIDLRYIPIPGIKNFVNHKLNELENLQAIIEIYISKEVSRIQSSQIAIYQLDNFYTIIGVLLDNIIDSIKEQKTKKLVSINVYMEDNVTNIELANTYKNNIDITQLTKFGYTSKGKNHGVGLYLVNKIIQDNKVFELNTKIDNQFFVQHLKIYHPDNHLKP